MVSKDSIRLDEDASSFEAIEEAIKLALVKNEWTKLQKIVLYLLFEGNSLERLVEISDMVYIPSIGRRIKGQVYKAMYEDFNFLTETAKLLFVNELSFSVKYAGCDIKDVPVSSPYIMGPPVSNRLIVNTWNMGHENRVPYLAQSAIEIANTAILIRRALDGKTERIKTTMDMIDFMVEGYHDLEYLLKKGIISFQWPIKTFPTMLK